MRAHAAVLGLLAYDPVLQSVYGLNLNNIWPAQSVDVVPRKKPFIILRWEEETLQRGGFGRREVLTVWAHEARESSTDYGRINEILDRVEEILMGSIHISGVDGVLTQVTYNGRSGELNDEGYKTITRNAAFTVGAR